MGPLLVRCLLVALTADPVEANAAVATETRAGEMPLFANQQPKSFVATVVTPEASIDVRRPNTTLRLRYYPRLYWQETEGADATAGQVAAQASGPAQSGVLAMHQASLSLSTKVASTTLVTAVASAAYGTPDYAALPQLLPTGQAVLPLVQHVFSASGSGGLQADLSRRWQLTFGANISHFQPVGTPTLVVDSTGNPLAAVPIQTSTTVSGSPGVVFQATHVDYFAVAVGATYVDLPKAPHLDPFTRPTLAEVDAALFIVNPMLTWRRRLARDSEVRLGAGVSHASDLGTKKVTAGQPALVPTAVGQFITRLVAAELSTVGADVKVGVDDYVDPILAISGPRLLVSARLALDTVTRWSAALQADFSTSWASVPPPQMIPGITPTAITLPDLTSVFVSLPVRYRVSSHFSIEGGARWADRGPSLSSSQFAFHQRQLWGYVALTLTTRNEAAPVIR